MLNGQYWEKKLIFIFKALILEQIWTNNFFPWKMSKKDSQQEEKEDRQTDKKKKDRQTNKGQTVEREIIGG